MEDYEEELQPAEIISTDNDSTEIESLIYVGPNIYKMAMHRFQVYRGGLPPHVTRAIEKIPEIKNLIVPVTELETMRQKINKAGTNESRLFDSVRKSAEKVKRNGI